jgi:hypothetical protein
MSPPGTHIARWYCPQGHRTFSLLPDHLAARFPGTLAEIERVVSTVQAVPSLSACVESCATCANTKKKDERWSHLIGL